MKSSHVCDVYLSPRNSSHSVTFCHQLDLSYVSCSPDRVPVARLATQAAVAGAKTK